MNIIGKEHEIFAYLFLFYLFLNVFIKKKVNLLLIYHNKSFKYLFNNLILIEFKNSCKKYPIISTILMTQKKIY